MCTVERRYNHMEIGVHLICFPSLMHLKKKMKRQQWKPWDKTAGFDLTLSVIIQVNSLCNPVLNIYIN